MSTRTVTLELLRHGSSNNQLLSPLTPYLALSGNHDAETVHVGFEHVQMLRRMRGLRYQDSRAAAVGALEEVSDEVSRLVSGIRSLTAELSSIPRGGQDIIHLRLVLSAAELSLLPFELIRSPAGFPGQGQWLSLQTTAPIVVTREVRRVSASTRHWPGQPRILVAAADPPGVAPVPLRAHLLALRWALRPWLYRDTPDELSAYVTVVPQATIAAVREACAKAAGEGRAYTHVHVLAHGVPDEALFDGLHGYGLAFHKEGDPNRMDVVSGTRLAAALRCHPSGPVHNDLAGPAVVTVASCDSANVGDVIAPGASIAHQLHEAGVPLVLASQFPLSVRGSVIMVETVYSRLLRGEDPRPLVHDLRQALHVACPETHDWASVVAYAALPEDFDAQIQRVRVERALSAVNGALSSLDEREASGVELGWDERNQFKPAMKWLEDTMPEGTGAAVRMTRARVYGVLANANKRAAQLCCGGPLWPILRDRDGASLHAAAEAALPGDASPAASIAPEVAAFVATPRPPGRDDDAAERQHEARVMLEYSRRCYLQIFRDGMVEAWPVVQYLANSAALFPPGAARTKAERIEANRTFKGYWTTAHLIAEDNLKSRTGREVAWAHSALVELYVLAQLLPASHWARKQADRRAHRHLDAFLQAADDMDKYSLRRQLLRYTDWWWRDDPTLARLPRELDQKMDRMGVERVHVRSY